MVVVIVSVGFTDVFVFVVDVFVVDAVFVVVILDVLGDSLVGLDITVQHIPHINNTRRIRFILNINFEEKGKRDFLW